MRIATRLLVIGILCFGVAITSGQAKELTLNDIFPTDRVIDVQITLSERDWDTIRYQGRDFRTALGASRQYKPMERPYTYVEASVSIDGVVFPNVGVRKKGFIGSLSHTRPSLKIRLNHTDKDQSIEGLTNLTLNNNKQDTSLMSQFMGYALFNAIGSPASRCAYAKVTVNGKALGIYSHVETVRKPLIKRAFGNTEGPLYEGTVVDFYEDWENSFEHKRGDDARGRERIKALIQVLSERSVTEADIAEYVDLESFYRFWAIEGLVGFWDGYSGNKNNFFFYLNPEDNKFHFLPWGMDSIFTKLSKLEFMNDRRAPFSVKTQGLIAHKLYQLETGRKRYAAAMTEILDQHWDATELLATLEKAALLVEPHLAAEQRVIEEWDRGRRRGRDREQPTFHTELESVREFIRNREADIREEIAGGMPIWRKRPEPPFVIPEDDDFMGEFLKWMEDSLSGAAIAGDLKAIKEHLVEGADVNERQFNRTPLGWAALMGKTESVELLLQRGAEIDATDDEGNTALTLAIFLAHAETAELLINSGADLHIENHDGASPIDTLNAPWEMTQFVTRPMGIKLERETFEANRAKIRELLSGKVALPEATDPKSDVWKAAASGDIGAIESYIEAGGDLDVLDGAFRLSALEWSALHGQPEAAEILLAHGADPNRRNGSSGSTPLHAAAFLGKPDIVKLLLAKGADREIRNNDGLTPVDSLSVDWETTTFILGLLGLKAGDAEIAAIKAGRAAVAEIFGVEGMAEKTVAPQELTTAVFIGHITGVKQALADGADPNAKDPESGTPILTIAALMGYTDIVALLLEQGADINAKGGDGGTALHAAAFFGRPKTVEFLLEKGADAGIRNSSGGTALDGAKLNWLLAKGIIAMLQIEVDEEETKAGRARVVEILTQGGN